MKDVPNEQPAILVVDDDEMMIDMVCDTLKKEGYRIHTATDCTRAVRLMHEQPIDLLISDIRIGEESGLDLSQTCRKTSPQLPIVLITGYPDARYFDVTEEIEISSFLTKPFTPQQLRFSVMQGLEKIRKTAPIVKGDGADSTLGLAGNSPYIQSLRRNIRQVASGDFPVIICGESGTGKEIIAKAIHNCSARSGKPLLTINCAAIPTHLEEAEFFGHVRGAFTGAVAAREGIFSAADGSTLFLDEIGELSPGIQAKLLRVLENGEFSRVGENHPIHVDVRIIVATNRELEEMVETGLFRRDLFFRLKGELIRTAPLGGHSEDIPVLVNHFLGHAGGEGPRSITRGALTWLAKRPWAGNIRELKHAVNRLRHAARGLQRINLSTIQTLYDTEPIENDHDRVFRSAKEQAVREFELDYFSRLLQRMNGNLEHVAETAGMDRRNLSKKLKSLDLSPDQFRR